MAKYLLPCRCNRTHEVETGQAGRMIQCQCGAELEVPSVRGLQKLEMVSMEVAAPIWGLRQAVLFVGLAILVFGLGAAGYFQLRRPSASGFSRIRAEVEGWPPVKQSVYWNYLLVFGIGLATPEDVQMLTDDETSSDRSGYALIAAGVGLAITIVALLLPRSSNGARSDRPPTTTKGKRRNKKEHRG